MNNNYANFSTAVCVSDPNLCVIVANSQPLSIIHIITLYITAMPGGEWGEKRKKEKWNREIAENWESSCGKVGERNRKNEEFEWNEETDIKKIGKKHGDEIREND